MVEISSLSRGKRVQHLASTLAMYSAALASSRPSARSMPARNSGSVDPAFAHITWARRSGRTSVTALAIARDRVEQAGVATGQPLAPLIAPRRGELLAWGSTDNEEQGP
eukprot:2057756-Lingulodinium_polyedra.AAC.1